MTDIFDYFADFSYFGIFLVLVAVNAVPILMPPSWMVLSSFYALEQSLDPILLSVIGATGATIGRFFLKRIVGLLRRFVTKEYQSNLDIIGDWLNKKRYGYLLASFLFAVSPLPSNMLFVAYGLMKAKNIGIYIGFWTGRVVAYYVMIVYVSETLLIPFLELFQDRFIGILIADGMGIGVVILFASINWALLITERKLKLVKPKLWRF